ncbi:MAG: Uma2 family endonuclease [Chthoniobacterales bacterium]|nr:Uma2 family endonuclease [Chthoniobacterales bacterium]
MPGIAPPLLTVEDYKILPETGPRYQLIEGDLYMAPAPNRYHQDISRNLEYILLEYLEAHPVGILYHAPFDVYLDQHNAFQPDIVVVLNRSLGILTDAGAAGTPEFVVEILSPKTARLDRVHKLRVYAQTGVQELWIIAPENRTIEVFLLGENAVEPAQIHDAQARFGSAHFPGLEFDAARIFAR